MVKNILKVLLAAALVAGLHLVVAPPAAQADPSRNAGCKSVEFVQKYQLAGVTAYGQNRSFRFCWTGGLVTQSKIYNITGDANCWSNATFGDQNCKGPTNLQKVPISSSDKFANGVTYIYFWFQSRNCATGPLHLACSSWSWHGAKYRIKQGGGVDLSDPDV